MLTIDLYMRTILGLAAMWYTFRAWKQVKFKGLLLLGVTQVLDTGLRFALVLDMVSTYGTTQATILTAVALMDVASYYLIYKAMKSVNK